MERRLAERDRLERLVADLLALFERELSLQSGRDRLVSRIRSTLRRATDDRAEVVFVGPSGAGKSSIIKALLGRDLLYSGCEGHITGTECRILWADSTEREGAALTYASLADIVEELEIFCQQLGLDKFLRAIKTDQFQSLGSLIDAAEAIQRTEGGSGRDRSARAKLAGALIRLARGLKAHYTKIRPRERYREAKADLRLAAEAGRFGSHSAVLQQIEYHCHHPLLREATLVDLPGWDAPLAQGAQLILEKIRDPDVAAIVCVLPVTAAGELTAADREFVSILESLPAAGDSIFWVFNYRDRAWLDEQGRRALRRLRAQITDSRSCDACAILGFYSPFLLAEVTDDRGRSGLEALNAVSLNPQETQLFQKVLLDYYRHVYSQRSGVEPLPISGDLEADFLQAVGTAGSGQALLEAARAVSGIPQLRQSLVTYLTQERRDRLMAALVAQLQTLGIGLADCYATQARELAGQPEDLAALESKLLFKELETLRYSLREIVQGWVRHLRALEPQLLPPDCRPRLHAKLSDRLRRFLQHLSLPTPASSEPVARVSRPQTAALAASLDAIAVELDTAACTEVRTILAACSDRLLAQLPQQQYYTLAKTLASAGPEPLETRWREALASAETSLQLAIAIECDLYRTDSDRLLDTLTADAIEVLSGRDPLAAEREAALREALTQHALEKASCLSAYVERALMLALQRLLLALTSESSQFQLYDRLSDLCRTQLGREIALRAREQLLENQRQQRELEAKIERYRQLCREIGAALQPMGVWDFTLPEIPTAESPRAEELQWPSA